MTEQEWHKESDWSTVKVGDRVRLVQPNGDVAEFAASGVTREWLDSQKTSYYQREGWQLYVTRPAVTLPTEPGFYTDIKGDPWKLASNGYWYDKGYINGPSNQDYDYIKSRAPFTRLEPVPVTARKVLDWALAVGLSDLDVLNGYKEFGVTE